MITEINIEMLHGHPDNPRKALGDLTELTDSVKVFGVLQNLTVVPDEEIEGTYKVVCGHRRLEAARQAGLKTLPCSVAEMDRKTQVSVMLLENMQRSDLTVQEEAQGFQMMLDLGDSIADIVKKTGLSETKIRHRVKLNDLDQEILKEKMARNITIGELIKLEQVKDPAARNKCLKEIGTNNFDWIVRQALQKQKKNEIMKRIEDALPDDDLWAEFGNRYGMRAVEELSYDAGEKKIQEFLEKCRELAEETEAGGDTLLINYGFNSVVCGTQIPVKRASASDEDPEKAEQEKLENEHLEMLEDAYHRMEDSWTEFIKGVTATQIIARREAVQEQLITKILDGYVSIDKEDMLTLVFGGLEEDEDGKIKIIEAAKEYQEKSLLAITFLATKPYTWQHPWGRKAQYTKLDRLIELYTFLLKLGYEAADEEIDIIMGDSELYLKEGK